MIYIARLFFLVGSTLMAGGVAAFVFMLLFERDLPEMYQGYWFEIVAVIFIAFVITATGQLLGNDICGSNRKFVDRAVESELRHFHRSDVVERYWILRGYQWVFVNIRAALTIFTAMLGKGD